MIAVNDRPGGITTVQLAGKQGIRMCRRGGDHNKNLEATEGASCHVGKLVLALSYYPIRYPKSKSADRKEWCLFSLNPAHFAPPLELVK